MNLINFIQFMNLINFIRFMNLIDIDFNNLNKLEKVLITTLSPTSRTIRTNFILNVNFI